MIQPRSPPSARASGLDVAHHVPKPPGYARLRRSLVGRAEIGAPIDIELLPVQPTERVVPTEKSNNIALFICHVFSDLAAVVTSTNQEPVDQSGWSIFCTIFAGVDQFNPAVHAYLRGNGRDGNIGWPTSTRIEELRDTWFAASDLAAQKKAAEQLQLQAFQDLSDMPLGQWRQPTAHRTDLQGMLTGLPLFWNIRRG